MSEVMLHGVLNCPIEPGDVMGVTQLKNRARQASELIYAQQKRIAELQQTAIDAVEQMISTSEYLVSVARLLNPGEHLISCPAGIHAFNLDAAGSILQEAISEGGADD